MPDGPNMYTANVEWPRVVAMIPRRTQQIELRHEQSWEDPTGVDSKDKASKGNHQRNEDNVELHLVQRETSRDV